MVNDSRTKVIGVIDAFINPHLYHCCKRCARMRQKKVHIPREIVFNILLYLPAHILHDVMRYVCREWSLVLQTQNFVYNHLRETTGGLIIQNKCTANAAIYVEMGQGCLKICKFDSGFKDVVWCSCNGLALGIDMREPRIIYVTNPVTKQWLILPPCIHAVRLQSICALAYVEASMEYKVVFLHGQVTPETPRQIILLTIGVDMFWRHIDTEHPCVPNRRALESTPIVTGSFIHWINSYFILTFNVETETFRRFPFPPFVRTIHRFLPMGSVLSLISVIREFFLWDVWEMNSQTGEWTMLLSIDLEVQKCQSQDLFCKFEDSIIPAGWLVPREVLVFSVDNHPRLSFACNVKTGELQSFEFEGTNYSRFYRPHVNSLVWFDGDSLREMEDYRLQTHCPQNLKKCRRRFS